MNERSPALFLYPAAIAGFAALLYAINRRRRSAAILVQIRDVLKQNIAETRALHRTLRRQRGAINDIRGYFIPPVSKRVGKAVS